MLYGENSVSLLGIDIFLAVPSDCVTTCPLTDTWEEGWVSSPSPQSNSASSLSTAWIPPYQPWASLLCWLFPRDSGCLMLHSLPHREETMGTPGRLLPQGRQEGLFSWPLKKYSSDGLLRIFLLLVLFIVSIRKSSLGCHSLFVSQANKFYTLPPWHFYVINAWARIFAVYLAQVKVICLWAGSRPKLSYKLS